MISKYLGFDSDYIIIGLCGVLLILFILTIVNIVQMKKLKKNYRIFMSGKDAKTLEDTLIQRLDQVDSLLETEENEVNHHHRIHGRRQDNGRQSPRQRPCLVIYGSLPAEYETR